jgi:hypothetical protein
MTQARKNPTRALAEPLLMAMAVYKTSQELL